MRHFKRYLKGLIWSTASRTYEINFIVPFRLDFVIYFEFCELNKYFFSIN